VRGVGKEKELVRGRQKRRKGPTGRYLTLCKFLEPPIVGNQYRLEIKLGKKWKKICWTGKAFLFLE